MVFVHYSRPPTPLDANFCTPASAVSLRIASLRLVTFAVVSALAAGCGHERDEMPRGLSIKMLSEYPDYVINMSSAKDHDLRTTFLVENCEAYACKLRLMRVSCGCMRVYYFAEADGECATDCA